MMQYRYIALFIMVSGILTGQVKQEYEKRISKEEMPNEAISVANPFLQQARRIRYYYEVDGASESFEIKFKKEGYHVSAEFSKEGRLEDIEVRWKFRSLPEATKKAIEAYLTAETDRWRIEKVQRQYVSEGNPVEKFKEALRRSEASVFNYECIVTTKKEGIVTRYEMLFAKDGSWLQSRKILRRSYDFILF
ncbi:hypothetical protein [Altibacter sp. HG106]|uniref:hypothetical protein n=1 Tax=Altibacter sp. HG106 TaxID=3023937 RepID=UPI00234FF355|nr:hypothetical protein [Altibacter sp. HG106]MDC7995241.1 hypothetical protein [Altibacter sp. HG106]